jgi:hypothetical protein
MSGSIAGSVPTALGAVGRAELECRERRRNGAAQAVIGDHVFPFRRQGHRFARENVHGLVAAHDEDLLAGSLQFAFGERLQQPRRLGIGLRDQRRDRLDLLVAVAEGKLLYGAAVKCQRRA